VHANLHAPHHLERDVAEETAKCFEELFTATITTGLTFAVSWHGWHGQEPEPYAFRGGLLKSYALSEVGLATKPSRPPLQIRPDQRQPHRVSR